MNTFGRIFRISIHGESHGEVIGVVIDGCPAGIPLSAKDFTEDLNRRKPLDFGTTGRKESDIPQLLSGVFNGFSTGAPILVNFRNENIKSQDYEDFRNIPRPGSPDFVAKNKFKGFNDFRGGGAFSGRMTLALVAAGVIAKKIISPISIKAELISVGGSKDITNSVKNAKSLQDSLGGIIECSAENVPIGLGEPFFDSAESLISHILFSIPGVKALEFGAGVQSAAMLGSEFNDVYLNTDGKTATNNSGGIAGGITNGNNLSLKVTFRPASSISKPQKTLNFQTGDEVELAIKGRHDVCYAQRTSVIVESAVAIALADMMLISKAI
ncbi:MAG: chorismate synthase [Ignavibacteria bacterium]|nr:chorismate synthase [Ignavibacteria bacterium]